MFYQNLLSLPRFTGNCTFDGGMCEWINDPTDEFDWQLIEGGTPSEETGPTAGYKGEG